MAVGISLPRPRWFNRTSSADSRGRIAIHGRQIYIVPTRFGIVFAFMLVAMLVGSNNYGINLGFMLTFLLAGLGLATLLQTWRNLAGLEFFTGHAEPVFAGQDAEFTVTCFNNRSVERSAIQVCAGVRPVIHDLPENQRVQFVCPVPSTRRGRLKPGRWTVYTLFPMGMFRSWAYFETGQSCIVYPKPVDTEIDPGLLLRSDREKSNPDQDNMDFIGHRKYQAGDNPRSIDWKALARGKGTLVKQFKRDDDDNLWLDWSAIDTPDRELRLSILCRAVLELSRANAQFGLKLPGVTLEPDRGDAHRTQCLTRLALYE